MAIPEPIETFLLRLGFEYSAVRRPPADAPSGDPGVASDWISTHAFVSDRTPILAVVPGDARADPERLGRVAGLHALRPASTSELEASYPESEPGMMPPLGPLYGHEVFIDEGLIHRTHVVFAAGTREDAIRMRYGDFAELVHPTVGRFAVPA